MKIRVPIPVKMLITNQTKLNMLNEIRQSIHQMKMEMEQLQFQQKKLMADAQKKGKEAVRIVQDRIGMEHQKRKEKLDRLYIQVEQLERLEEGEEILHSTVETEIEIQIGQSWDEVTQSQEIIIKDGIIFDIRRG